MSGINKSKKLTAKFSYPKLTHIHRLWQQHLISTGYLTQKEGAEILARLLENFPYCLNGQNPAQFTLASVVQDLNEALDDVNMIISWVRGEHDGVAYLAFCNTMGDTLASKNWGLIDAEKEETLTVMKVIVNYLVQKK